MRKRDVGTVVTPVATARHGGLTVLVVGTDDWAIEQSKTSLETAGHHVLRCHEPGEDPFPCNALVEGRRCPLDLGFDVVVTTRARPQSTPGPAEFGVVCALHAHAPLVVAGITARNPFEAWATTVVDRDGDVATACEEAARRKGTIDLRDRRGASGDDTSPLTPKGAGPTGA